MASSAPPLTYTALYNPAERPDAALLCNILHRATGFGSDLTLDKLLLLLLTNLHEINSTASLSPTALAAAPCPLQITAQDWAEEQLYLHFGAVRAGIACTECKRSKRKCIASSPNGGCDTCLRKGIPCVPRSNSGKNPKRKRKEPAILPAPENRMKRMRLHDDSALCISNGPTTYENNCVLLGSISEQYVDLSAFNEPGIPDRDSSAVDNLGSENMDLSAIANLGSDNMSLSAITNLESENMNLSACDKVDFENTDLTAINNIGVENMNLSPITRLESENMNLSACAKVDFENTDLSAINNLGIENMNLSALDSLGSQDMNLSAFIGSNSKPAIPDSNNRNSLDSAFFTTSDDSAQRDVDTQSHVCSAAPEQDFDFLLF
ncbi:hypothetical protein AC578_7067 [Pseudocercospora eumusae]|uniref:Zn(2)-C6 fungal-type domain-containing protein n=1 Tax=Pseudocercospora eumusae TaxID=321146 RepID=A0A139HFS2_9PEZI|nr:hypothetical protein AC578_7067 [Pseudocercospora eumusae]